jgi:hypothetical protein
VPEITEVFELLSEKSGGLKLKYSLKKEVKFRI